MSYLAFDLDALKMVPDCARSAGTSEAELGYGLLRLWQFCWLAKTDTVDSGHLAGFFPGAEREALACGLVAFGFLAPDGDKYRVRGAERYLRISEGRSRGGKMAAAAGNPRRGHKKKLHQLEGEAGGDAGDKLQLSSSSAGASPPAALQLDSSLSPNTEHRAPNSKSTAPVELPTGRPRETDALVGDFQAITGTKYAWQGAKDGVAFARLRKDFSLEEIRDRWRKGLQSSGWLKVATVAQLASKWNDLAPERGFSGLGAVTATEGAL